MEPVLGKVIVWYGEKYIKVGAETKFQLSKYRSVFAIAAEQLIDEAGRFNS
jgi:hypothetical protein